MAAGGPPGGPPADEIANVDELLLVARAQPRPAVIEAHTFIRSWKNSFSKPVALIGSDGKLYVVKGRHNSSGNPEMPRALVTEQVVAGLGRLLRAPIPPTCLVLLPPELVTAQPEMNHMQPGLSHGCQFIDDLTEKEGVAHETVPANRPRFSLLAVLYGWALANDSQFFYGKSDPHLVYSCDHGLFFLSGAKWNEASLRSAPTAALDPAICQKCSFSASEIRAACGDLARVQPLDIASAVAAPPDEWGVTEAERHALLEYLLRRQQHLLQMAMRLPGG